MAKKKVSKTELIKEALRETPDATPRDIANALKKHGVTATYVSNVKSTMNAKPKRRGRPPGTTKAAKKTTRKTAAPSVASSGSLDAAIKFVQQSGGLKAAKQAIEKIEQIKSL